MVKVKSISEVHSKKYDGKQVSLRGWAYRVRQQKKLVFIILRDSTGTIQCVVKKGSKAFKAAQKITKESSLKLSGKLKQDDRAPTGYELQVKSLELVDVADTYPIARDKSEEFLLDVRHLALRMPKYTAMMRVRSKVFEAAREFLHKKGYVEGTPPVLVKQASEGGSTQFKLDYFGEEASLSQSWQMHGESMIQALEKVYCIAPSFRAEKSRTRRHVTEFWHCEVEAAWVKMKEMQKLGEDLIVFICKRVGKDCKQELKTLGADAKKLKKVKIKEMTYKQARKKLKIRRKRDFSIKDERKLAEKGVVAVTHYPKKILKFYHKRDPKHKKQGLNFNILFPGIGEVLDGSERESDLKELKKSAKKQGIKPSELGFYLDSRRYGAVPHSGFGLGLARLIMWICETDSIRDVIPFPRTPSRIYP